MARQAELTDEQSERLRETVKHELMQLIPKQLDLAPMLGIKQSSLSKFLDGDPVVTPSRSGSRCSWIGRSRACSASKTSSNSAIPSTSATRRAFTRLERRFLQEFRCSAFVPS